MVSKYLNGLKERGNFSLAYLTKATEYSESTIRKILSGETSNPGIDTVIALVTAMGGKMSDLDQNGSNQESEQQINSMIALKESYESRIREIKESSDKYIESVVREKRFFQKTVCLLGGLLLIILIIDVLVGTVGWIRH